MIYVSSAFFSERCTKYLSGYIYLQIDRTSASNTKNSSTKESGLRISANISCFPRMRK